MSRTKRFLILLLSAFIPVMMAAAVEAAGGNCLSCHGEKTIINKGAHLYIDPVKYDLTTHARIGCVSCHTKVTQRHPADGIRPSRAKCEECHAAVFSEYEKSAHSQYANCADCHKPHAVKPLLAVSSRDINMQCAKCHDYSDTVKSHAKWLPQAALHVDELPCITCHTGSKEYVITLYMVKNVSESHQDGVALVGYDDLRPLLPAGEKVGRLIDTNGDGAVSLGELKAFNTNSQYKNISLMGTMLPETATHDFQILQNRWDCTFCHASGPNAQQNSYLAFPKQDGTYTRMSVERGAILDILYGTPDFYMTGFTRSKTLSIIGGLIVISGLMVPVVHGTLRFLTRNRRKGAAI